MQISLDWLDKDDAKFSRFAGAPSLTRNKSTMSGLGGFIAATQQQSMTLYMKGGRGGGGREGTNRLLCYFIYIWQQITLMHLSAERILLLFLYRLTNLQISTARLLLFFNSSSMDDDVQDDGPVIKRYKYIFS